MASADSGGSNPLAVSAYSLSKLSWPDRNLNNLRTEVAMKAGLVPLESSPRGGPKSSLYKLLNWRETTVPESHTKVNGNKFNHSFPALHAPEFCHELEQLNQVKHYLGACKQRK